MSLSDGPTTSPATGSAIRIDLGRRADIQGLRAIAVAVVVAYHAGVLLPGGYVGVDMFFVISGFVISRLLLNELASTDSIDFRNFYVRRARRLLPALALVVTIVLLASALFVPVSAQVATARTGLGATILNSNNYLWLFGSKGGYFQAGAKANGLLHMWSLSVEEQFYLVFPALLLLGWKLRRRPAVKVVLAATIVASFTMSIILTFGPFVSQSRGTEIAFYAAPARAWEFAVGGVVALASARWRRMRSSALYASAGIGAGCVAFSCLRFSESTQFPGVAALLPVTGTALLIVAGSRPRQKRSFKILENSALVYIGDVSYGWYLWHWPLIVVAASMLPNLGIAKPAAAVGSFLVAVVMYRFYENPIRRRPPISQARPLWLAAVCIVVPLLAVSVLEVAHGTLYPQNAPSRFAGHADSRKGCMTETLLTKPPKAGCTQTVEDARGLAVLIGDSNAGQFTEGFMAAALRAHLDARVATRGSCAFTDLAVYDAQDKSECNPYVEASLDELVRLRPRIVFIARNSDGYVEVPRFKIAARDGTFTETDPAIKASAWRAADMRMIRRLEAAGAEVVLINPVPKFPGWDTVDLAPVRLLLPLRFVQQTYPREYALNARARATVAEEEAAQDTGAQDLDFFNDLCPGDPCTTNKDGHVEYLDGGHISVFASEHFESKFERLMAP